MNIIKPLVEADCGEILCQCISHIQRDDILEILRYCPVAVYHNVLLKSSIETIYEKLLLAAARSSNIKNSIRLVKMLIEKNVSITNMEENGISPIDAAASTQNTELVGILLGKGAKLKLEALELLVSGFHGREFYELKRSNFNLNLDQRKKQEINRGNLCLLFHIILMNGAIHGTLSAGILYLMENEAKNIKNTCYNYSITSLDTSKHSAMQYAAMYNQAETIGLLYAHGGKKLLETCSFVPGLHQTIVSSHRMFRGYTPLAIAVQNRHVACVKTLLSLGADPFASSGASVLNYNPACPYWLSLNVYIMSHERTVDWVDDNPAPTANNATQIHIDISPTPLPICKIARSKLQSVEGDYLRACKQCKNGYEIADDKEEYIKITRTEKKQATKGSKMISPHHQTTYTLPTFHAWWVVDKAESSGYSKFLDAVSNSSQTVLRNKSAAESTRRQRIVIRRWRKM